MGWNEKVVQAGIEIFKRPARQDIRVLRIGVYGLTNSGKTHFALTAPEPVFVIDTELGARPVVTRAGSPFLARENGGTADRDKDIRIADVLVKNEEGEVDLIKSLRATEEAIEVVCKYAAEHQDQRGTIVLDTASELWAWYGLWLESEGATRFTKSGEMLRVEWGKVNRPYTQQMYRMMLSGWNVVVTGKAREIYTRGGEPTGMFTGRWQKDTEHWLDVVLEARHLGTHREFRTVKNRLKDSVEVFKNPVWEDVWQSTVGRPWGGENNE